MAKHNLLLSLSAVHSRYEPFCILTEEASEVNESELVGSFNHIEAKFGFNDFGNLIILLYWQRDGKIILELIQLICPVKAGNLFTVTGKQVAIDKGGSVPTTGIT